jgi:hypothetical protein
MFHALTIATVSAAVPHVQRNLLLLATLAAVASPASGQQAAPAARQANIGPQSAGAIPDLSGTWRHGNLPWFIPPASGPGPVISKTRYKDNGVVDIRAPVGDYTNPILQPWTAEVVKIKGELSLVGRRELSKPVQHMLARTGTVPFQAFGHANAAAA